MSGEHTPRNLLIRAARPRAPPPAPVRRRAWREYLALRAELGVAPHLEKLLAGQLPEAAAAPVAAAAGAQGGRPAGRQRRRS